MKTLISALILTLPLQAFGGSITAHFGEGTRNTKDKLFGVQFAYSPLKKLPFITLEAGFGTIHAIDFLAKGTTYFGNMSVGFEVTPSFFYAKAKHGAALLSKTDRQLGTHYQFLTELSAGFRVAPARIGLAWRHFSNGRQSTEKRPNWGKDFLSLEVVIEL